jgi:hypothetical protein
MQPEWEIDPADLVIGVKVGLPGCDTRGLNVTGWKQSPGPGPGRASAALQHFGLRPPRQAALCALWQELRHDGRQQVRLWLTCAPALELGRTRCDNALPRLPTWLHARAGGRGRVRDGAQGDVAPHAGRRQGAARVGRGRARRLQARRAP